MKFKTLIISFIMTGCATHKVCINQIENQRSVYDVENSCRLRIRQVVIGSDSEIPKSIDFKSNTTWSYAWSETRFENGKLVLGHFVMVPSAQELNKDSYGK